MKTTFNIAGKDITVKENLVDRAVRYFSPVKGQERFKARTMTAMAGGYIGASKNRRATKSWDTSTHDADTDIQFDLPTLRERSDDLIKNNPLATGIINTPTTNVVGSGLKAKPQIDAKLLGMSEDEADEWEEHALREFNLFANSVECDAERKLNFGSLQEMAFRTTLARGDALTLLKSFERTRSPYDLKLQVIEGDRLSNKDNVSDTEKLSSGVVKDDNGAAVKYQIQKQHPGKIFGQLNQGWIEVDAYGSSGRRNIIHNFIPLRPGQSRGLPYLSPVIESLKQIQRYTEAELMAAVISGMFTVFIKTERDTGNDASSVLSMPGEDEDNGTNDQRDLSLGNGKVMELLKDESIESVDPKRPNTAFDPFVQAILRQVGVALEIPFEMLIMHFTSSYSAARSSLLQAWKFFKKRRKWLSDYFCDPVYEAWMDEAVATGRIVAPGYFDDPLIKKAYLG
ncbi:MAG: phage portal protein, partial [Candidatus Omnitrophica bacterium]|nr:phage portal protein [Candidatus Omnitrophota bacterium]